MRIIINSINGDVFASLAMLVFHIVNFAGFEAGHVIHYFMHRNTPEYPSALTLKEFKVTDMINKTYFTYMTFVLFYLVYCFGQNRQLGKTLYQESLVESEEASQEKQKKQQNYWRWLMNEMNYEGVEYGSLDQAVLQEYVDLKVFEQQLEVDVRDDINEIDQMETTHSRSLAERTTEFDFRD